MPNLLKKLLLSLLASLVLLGSTAPYFAAKAQTQLWYNQDFGTFIQKVDDTSNPTEIFGERYTAAQVQWVIWGLINFLLLRVLPPDVVSCVFSNTVDINACSSVVLRMITSSQTQSNLASAQNKTGLLSSVFNTDRPFSGIGYIKNKIDNFSLVPVAHAQTGIGFNALNTVQSLWVSIRNVSYGLFALIAVVFAFMIMFRIKLSPQTAITVQSAIPKIIIGLVLVTFSYAIAGLLIDLMYVVIALVSSLLSPMVPTVTLLQPNSAFGAKDLFNLLTVGPTNTTATAGSSTTSGILGLLMMYLTPLIFIAFLFLVVMILLAAPTGGITGIIGLIVFLIIIVVALFMAIKVIWVLFKAYANVLLLTIFAPIQLTLGIAIPSLGFNQWFRSFISNLSVFVVTGVLWFFAWVFMLKAWHGAFPGGNLTLSVTGGAVVNAWPPLLGTGGSGWAFLLFLGVSFVLFTMIPKSAELVQSFLTGKPFAYGSGIGEALVPVSWAYGASGAKDLVDTTRFGRMATMQAGAMSNTQLARLMRWGMGVGSGANPEQIKTIFREAQKEKKQKAGYPTG